MGPHVENPSIIRRKAKDVTVLLQQPTIPPHHPRPGYHLCCKKKAHIWLIHPTACRTCTFSPPATRSHTANHQASDPRGASDKARPPASPPSPAISTITTPCPPAILIMSGAATPHAPASARASLPPTGSATALQALQAPAPASPGLPPPTTFDILPDLHRLLKRLIDTAPTPTPAQANADGPLEIQHVATAATDIRLKIQRAQRAVLALPEIDRTCEDQEEEIEDLEARIARLKASLRELARPTDTAEDGDQRMTG